MNLNVHTHEFFLPFPHPQKCLITKALLPRGKKAAKREPMFHFPLKLGSGLVWMLVDFIFHKLAQPPLLLRTKEAFAARPLPPNPRFVSHLPSSWDPYQVPPVVVRLLGFDGAEGHAVGHEHSLENSPSPSLPTGLDQHRCLSGLKAFTSGRWLKTCLLIAPDLYTDGF